MKKLLIITYYWPPSGGSGVQRWMYFAKYLKEIGHEVTILTVDSKYASYNKLDKSLLENSKTLKTYRTKTFELTKIYSRIISKSERDGIPQGSIENKNSLFQKIARFVRGNFFIPDSRVGWNKYALKTGRQIIKNEKPDLIITTGPPHSTHLIGRQLKKEFGIKWMADFRDPWLEIYYNNLFIKTKWAKLQDVKLEKMVIDEADKILTIGKNMCSLLQTKSVEKGKFEFIYNGFDQDLLSKVANEKSDFFDIVFTGLLSNNQNISGLLNMLVEIENHIEEKTVRFLLAGKIDSTILEQFQNKLRKVETKYLGYLSHENAIATMKNANLLITVLPILDNSEIMISGKIMEYISTGNPILMFGSDRSEAAELLRILPNTLTCRETDSENAVNFVIKYFLAWQKNIQIYHAEHKEFNLESFSRKNTALQLSALIEEI